MHRIDAGALVVIGFQLGGIGKQIGIVCLDGLPAAGRRAGTADAGIGMEAGLQLALGHHLRQRAVGRAMGDVGRQLQRGDMFLVIDHPVDLGIVDAELLDQDRAGPHAGGDRIGAHADPSALEILGHLDVGVGTDQQAGMVETPQHEDRQRLERRAVGAGDDVGGRSQFADVELDLTDHPAEGRDLRLDRDDLGLDALDRNGAVADGGGMRRLGDGDLEMDLGHWGFLP